MRLNFKRNNGLIPVIVQDYQTDKVLMLAYMDERALQKTRDSGQVTFFSRKRNSLWVKGETSGNYLTVKEIIADCDRDTLLIKALPSGPVCHTGKDTCFAENNVRSESFLYQLEQIVRDRKIKPRKDSYTSELYRKGLRKIAQKIGEEATEVVIDAVVGNTDLLKEETADLLYHLLILLAEENISLVEIEQILKNRHKG